MSKNKNNLKATSSVAKLPYDRLTLRIVMLILRSIAFVCVVSIVAISHVAVSHAQKQAAPQVAPAALGDTKNVHSCGNLFLAGQPTPADVEILKSKGINRVVTLRADGEIDWDEKKAITDAGMEFVSIPISNVESLTDEVFGEIRKLLSEQQTKTVLHCGSANRVGGVWIAHRVLDQGVELETAVREAKEIGLRNELYEMRVRAYVNEMSAAPKATEQPTTAQESGLNDNFLKADLDIEEWLARFEVESREVYAAREQILKACGVKPGMQIADVGAGTGLYTRLFAHATGPQGWVYAVDISPRFLQHINEKTESDADANVTTVLCSAKSTRLPPASVDMAFVCDTYHHFEHPESTLHSIHGALRPGGTLVVIDFERVPGTSREWVVNHVRAGKPEFRAEIEAAGFGFVEEVHIDGFEENYFLRFQKR